MGAKDIKINAEHNILSFLLEGRRGGYENRIYGGGEYENSAIGQSLFYIPYH
jgi:hypothetical protein